MNTTKPKTIDELIRNSIFLTAEETLQYVLANKPHGEHIARLEAMVKDSKSQLRELFKQAKPEDVNDPNSPKYNYEYTRGFISGINDYEANLLSVLGIAEDDKS